MSKGVQGAPACVDADRLRQARVFFRAGLAYGHERQQRDGEPEHRHLRRLRDDRGRPDACGRLVLPPNFVFFLRLGLSDRDGSRQRVSW